MKRLMLQIACVLMALVSGAGEPLIFEGNKEAFFGIYIKSIDDGKLLADYNSAKALTPASVVKCVTAASAMLLLDDDSVFSTRVYCDGEISDGVLYGNLVVKGDGDPTLESRHFVHHSGFVDSLVVKVHSLGIDSIAGRVIVDGSRYGSSEVSLYWMLEDMAWEYGAELSAINYKDNSFFMTLPDAETIPAEIPGLQIVDDLRQGTETDVLAVRSYRDNRLVVSGTYTGENYKSYYSVPNVKEMLHIDIKAALSDYGIGLGEDNIKTNEVRHGVIDWKSPCRDDILKSMMARSDNLYAEGMLMALVKKEAKPSAKSALKIQDKLWSSRGVDLSMCQLRDGSGLSRTDRLTPYAIAKVLETMAASEMSDCYVSVFPRVGKEGSVRNLLAKTRLSGRLALKSGSMNGVLCYAGYKLGIDGNPTHVVVVMVNNFSCKIRDVRSAIAKYLLNKF